MERRDYTHPHTQSDEFYSAISQILGYGYTLIVRDLVEIAPHYGYSESTASQDILHGPHATMALKNRGVDLGEDKYRGRRIYWDRNAETILADVVISQRRVDDSYKRPTKHTS